MEIELEEIVELRFDDGTPVRAASAVVPFGDGFLVVQDDATYAAWVRVDSVVPVGLLPAVQGRRQFEDATGTKHLKPDLEAACEITVDGRDAVLMLGSGSSPARMRSALTVLRDDVPEVLIADLSALYDRVARALEVETELLNLEGACVVGDTLHWFQRGMPAAGIPTGSVDLDCAEVLAAARGELDPGQVRVHRARPLRLGSVSGIGLGTTDAVTLPGGGILVSAAAEDSPNPRDDGPVVGSALALLVDHEVQGVSALPEVRGATSKVEGLMVLDSHPAQLALLAVVDQDDATAASLALRLRVRTSP